MRGKFPRPRERQKELGLFAASNAGAAYPTARGRGFDVIGFLQLFDEVCSRLSGATTVCKVDIVCLPQLNVRRFLAWPSTLKSASSAASCAMPSSVATSENVTGKKPERDGLSCRRVVANVLRGLRLIPPADRLQ